MSIERDLIKSLEPLRINEEEETTVQNQRGIWANRDEVRNWRGPIPISDYTFNEDSTPDLITKTIHQPVEYTQDIAVKYLKPPTPPPHGDLIIRQENDIIRPAAPAQIIRQLAPRPRTPEPLIIRERPPVPPTVMPTQLISLPGKVIDPPPRKVIIERMAQLPAKPQPVIIEKWLPYERQKRKVVYQPPTIVGAPAEKPKNVIIQWQVPNSVIKKEIRYLGVEKTDPNEYVAKHSSSLKETSEVPRFALDWDHISKSAATSDELKRELEKLKLKVVDLNPHNELLFTRHYVDAGNGFKLLFDAGHLPSDFHELEGDLDALKLVDLDREGLSSYKTYSSAKKSDFSTVYTFSSSSSTTTTNF